MDSPLPSPSPAEESPSRSSSPSLPLTMTASAILSDLPASAADALSTAGSFPPNEKVIIKFKAVGSAPSLAQDVCKITAERKFEVVVRSLRRMLRCKETDSVFLYVNSAFAPSLDEVVGNLHRCFKNGNDQLIVAYSMTPAFG